MILLLVASALASSHARPCPWAGDGVHILQAHHNEVVVDGHAYPIKADGDRKAFRAILVGCSGEKAGKAFDEWTDDRGIWLGSGVLAAFLWPAAPAVLGLTSAIIVKDRRLFEDAARTGIAPAADHSEVRAWLRAQALIASGETWKAGRLLRSRAARPGASAVDHVLVAEFTEDTHDNQAEIVDAWRSAKDAASHDTPIGAYALSRWASEDRKLDDTQFQTAQQSGTEEALNGYVSLRPSGAHLLEAQHLIADLRATRALGSRTEAEYRAFLGSAEGQKYYDRARVIQAFEALMYAQAEATGTVDGWLSVTREFPDAKERSKAEESLLDAMAERGDGPEAYLRLRAADKSAAAVAGRRIAHQRIYARVDRQDPAEIRSYLAAWPDSPVTAAARSDLMAIYQPRCATHEATYDIERNECMCPSGFDIAGTGASWHCEMTEAERGRRRLSAFYDEQIAQYQHRMDDCARGKLLSCLGALQNELSVGLTAANEVSGGAVFRALSTEEARTRSTFAAPSASDIAASPVATTSRTAQATNAHTDVASVDTPITSGAKPTVYIMGHAQYRSGEPCRDCTISAAMEGGGVTIRVETDDEGDYRIPVRGGTVEQVFLRGTRAWTGSVVCGHGCEVPTLIVP